MCVTALTGCTTIPGVGRADGVVTVIVPVPVPVTVCGDESVLSNLIVWIIVASSEMLTFVSVPSDASNLSNVKSCM